MRLTAVERGEGAGDDDVVAQLRSLQIDRSEEERPKGRLLRYALVMMVVLVLAAAGWYALLLQRVAIEEPASSREAIGAAETAPPNAPPAPVVDRTSDWLVAGYVVARRQSLVSAEVTATVSALLVDAGTAVETGDVIARLDGSLAEADLRIARSRVDVAQRTIEVVQAERDEAEKALNRAQLLVENNAVSEANVDSARARFDGLTAQYHQAQAQHQVAVEEAERAATFLAKHTITAPFAGIVTGCDVEVGETVSPMSANGSSGVGVCTIFDPSSIEIEIDVSETMISRVQLNAEAQAFLDAYPNDALAATVSAIAPEANREKSTIRVRLKFEAPDPRLRPNMAVKVNLQKSHSE